MPTTHVEPGSESLLQEIAATVWKSRKVVVITGAGISTNSGIPDFRSENGLYSLIQAHFDAASKETSSDNGDADESDRSASADDALERPAKRRRVSRGGLESISSDPPEEPRRDNCQSESIYAVDKDIKAERSERESSIPPLSPDVSLPQSAFPFDRESLNHKEAQKNAVMEDAAGQEHAPGPPVARLSALAHPALTPVSSPRLSGREPELRQCDAQRSAQAEPLPFASSPPSLHLGPRSITFAPRLTHALGSSPLSSPPPILFDPYQEYPSRLSSPSPHSSTQDSISSRSQSEEPSSASTPLLTSQSSFASSSSRTSLPNLKGKDLFDAQIWSCPVRTSVFYTFATSLRQKVRTAEPTSSHHFVSILRDSRKLVRCYTQNIDQLEERVGLATSLELGAGSRYRFSARAGRSLGGPKGPIKDAEASAPVHSQPDGDPDDATPASQAAPHESIQDDGKPGSQIAPGSADQSKAEVTTEGDGQPITELASVGSLVDSKAAMTTVAPLPTSTSQGSQGPNRGVECVFLHGSLGELRCFQCGRTSPWDEETRLSDTMAGRQPACPHCAGATAARQERGKRALGVGKLRPDIVLYGEEHPHAHLISPIVQHDLSLGPDMLLILGTSMRVHGLKVLVKEFAKAVHDRGGKVVFVNFTKPPDSVWADVIDFWVQWDCDAWVGDLRQRKPALWLPPGTALPEEEKTKPPKALRKSGGGDNAKRRDSVKVAAAKRKGNSGPVKREDKEKDSILVGVAASTGDEIVDLPQDVTQPPPRSLRAGRAMGRERKLNPNAKRPASVRDHKQNAAYLSWKIMEDLQRITRNQLPVSTVSSPAPVQPKTKKARARKSAPAALVSQEEAPNPSPEQPSTHGKDIAPSDDKTMPCITLPLPGIQPCSLNNGTVESVPDQGDSISAAVKNRKRKRPVTWKKVQGLETPVSLDESNEQSQEGADSKSASTLPGPEAVLSLPLLPVRLPKLKSHGKTARGRKKLQVLEPQATSPGPRVQSLPSNVGSPPAQYRPLNAFAFTDPLLTHFGFPPHWHQAQPTRVDSGIWNPEEQLRRDQEAAMMLSEMRSRG